jgi:hypothetical protein
MIISHKYKFIFTRVAKTASSSLLDYKTGPLALRKVKYEKSIEEIRKHVAETGDSPVPNFVYENFDSVDSFCIFHQINDWNHIPMSLAKAYVKPWQYNSYFKFGFVRNPFDRIVSAFEYAKKWYKQNSKSSEIFRKNEQVLYLDDFKKWILHEYGTNGKLGKYGSQFEYVHGCDFIGRFENLDEHVKYATNKIDPTLYTPLNKINKSASSKKHYSEWYDDDTIEIVSHLWAKDIEKFGYKFEKQT